MRRIIFLLLLILCFALPSFAQEDDSLTPYETALQIIQEVAANNWIYLNLERLDLTELPSEVGNLANLQGLFLSDNHLETLPPEIANLTNLRYLELEGNRLTSLPPEIGRLETLMTLDIDENELISLPPEIAGLRNLRALYLVGNHLNSLPEQIGELSLLCQLDLRRNQFRHLPNALSRLDKLRDPRCELLIDFNYLVSPPQEVTLQGTVAILDYLENEAWWHIKRLIISAASGIGLIAAVGLGLVWRKRRGKRKRKNEVAYNEFEQ